MPSLPRAGNKIQNFLPADPCCSYLIILFPSTTSYWSISVQFRLLLFRPLYLAFILRAIQYLTLCFPGLGLDSMYLHSSNNI